MIGTWFFFKQQCLFITFLKDTFPKWKCKNLKCECFSGRGLFFSPSHLWATHLVCVCLCRLYVPAKCCPVILDVLSIFQHFSAVCESRWGLMVSVIVTQAPIIGCKYFFSLCTTDITISCFYLSLYVSVK